MKRRKGVLYPVVMLFACWCSLSCTPGKADRESIKESVEPGWDLLSRPELEADTFEQLLRPDNDLWQPVHPALPASTLVEPFEGGDAKSNVERQPS